LFGRIRSVSPTDRDYDIPVALEPAGDMSPTLPDYARFIQLHLRGLRGSDGALTAATIRALHSPVAPFDSATGFGLGWGIYTRDGYETRQRRSIDQPDQLLAAIAASAAQLLGGDDLSLVKACQNPQCVLFFYDTTKNHARRWCSMAACGNRAKVAAHYQRARGR